MSIRQALETIGSLCFFMQEGERVGKLLGIEGPELYKNILKPRIKVGNEFVTQGRNMVQVI